LEKVTDPIRHIPEVDLVELNPDSRDTNGMVSGSTGPTEPIPSAISGRLPTNTLQDEGMLSFYE
uniref:Cadherin_C domain-containing protein n=1 Tax=Echinostoma caproni TaxID=27848 RepID=A0A183A277_9TREM